MKVNFDHTTHETIIRLTRAETRRLTAVVNRETHGVADPEADESSQLDDALTELFT